MNKPALLADEPLPEQLHPPIPGPKQALRGAPSFPAWAHLQRAAAQQPQRGAALFAAAGRQAGTSHPSALPAAQDRHRGCGRSGTQHTPRCFFAAPHEQDGRGSSAAFCLPKRATACVLAGEDNVAGSEHRGQGASSSRNGFKACFVFQSKGREGPLPLPAEFLHVSEPLPTAPSAGHSDSGPWWLRKSLLPTFRTDVPRRGGGGQPKAPSPASMSGALCHLRGAQPLPPGPGTLLWWGLQLCC